MVGRGTKFLVEHFLRWVVLGEHRERLTRFKFLVHPQVRLRRQVSGSTSKTISYVTSR